MSHSETASKPLRVRLTLFAVGSVLWAFVAAIGAYALWRSNQARATAGDARQDSAPFVLVSSPKPLAVTPQLISDVKPAAPNVDDFTMVERSGRKVSRDDLLGKPWAACFIFTRCAGTCPAITTAMAKLQSEVKEFDVRLVSFTVDPENDTPERLRSFADAYGADAERWLFLSGEKNATYQLIKDSFQLPVQETVGKDRVPGYEVLHSNKVALVDAEGRVRGLYNGTDPVEMAKLRQALAEHARKSQPKVGESEPNKAAEEG